MYVPNTFFTSILIKAHRTDFKMYTLLRHVPMPGEVRCRYQYKSSIVIKYQWGSATVVVLRLETMLETPPYTLRELTETLTDQSSGNWSELVRSSHNERKCLIET